MFKDTFILKKNAWHMKLMTYIWGLKHYHFSHLCPYFWLSIFNVIISPVFLPVKFLLVTVLIKWVIIRGFWRFCVWAINGFERVCKQWADDYEKWCIKQQEKWDEERKKEIEKAKEKAIEYYKKINSNMMNYIEREIQYNSYRSSRGIAADALDYCENKVSKKWKRWLTLFIDLHKEKPAIIENLIKKANDFANQQAIYNTEKHSFNQTAFQKLETDEERVLKLQREAAKQEQQEMRAHALMLKQQENERKAKLRAEYRSNAIKAGKQRINKILKWAQPIAKIFIYTVGVCVALVGLFFLFKGINLLVIWFGNVEHKYYVQIGNILAIVGLVILAVGVAFLVTFGLVRLFKTISFPKIVLPTITIKLKIKRIFPKLNFSKFNKFFAAISNIFKFVWKIICKGAYYLIWPFIKFFKAIVSFFKIFKQTIKDECPAVIWKD